MCHLCHSHFVGRNVTQGRRRGRQLEVSTALNYLWQIFQNSPVKTLNDGSC